MDCMYFKCQIRNYWYGKMKIGIITFHFVNNYGGVLQAYALHEFIKKSFSVECNIIDYRHWFIRVTDGIRMFPVAEPMKNFLPWIRTISDRKERGRKFRRFIKTYGDLTATHLTYRQIPLALKIRLQSIYVN